MVISNTNANTACLGASESSGAAKVPTMTTYLDIIPLDISEMIYKKYYEAYVVPLIHTVRRTTVMTVNEWPFAQPLFREVMQTLYETIGRYNLWRIFRRAPLADESTSLVCPFFVDGTTRATELGIGVVTVWELVCDAADIYEYINNHEDNFLEYDISVFIEYMAIQFMVAVANGVCGVQQVCMHRLFTQTLEEDMGLELENTETFRFQYLEQDE